MNCVIPCFLTCSANALVSSQDSGLPSLNSPIRVGNKYAMKLLANDGDDGLQIYRVCDHGSYIGDREIYVKMSKSLDCGDLNNSKISSLEI